MLRHSTGYALAFPEGVRRIIYTTNSIEALNSKLRRAVRTRGRFPSDDAGTLRCVERCCPSAAQARRSDTCSCSRM
jgi:transposase-like protein